MMNFNLDNLSEIIDEVLTEFCVTYPIPNFNNKEQLEHLRSVLEQFGAEAFTDVELMEAISLAPKKFTLEAPKKDGTDPKLAAILKKKVKNADTGRYVTVASALNYKDQKGSGARSAYHAAAAMLKGAGYSEKNVDMVDDPNPEEPQYYAKQKPQVTPKSKVAPQQKPQPASNKKVVSKPLSTAKKQEDDAFFPKDKQLQKITEINKIVDKIPDANKIEKQKLKIAVAKIITGEDLNAAEKAIASEYITIPAASENKIYITSQRGVFASNVRAKILLPTMDDTAKQALYSYAETNEIFDKGQPISKKTMVASKLTDKRYNVEAKITKEGGKVTAVTIGKTTLKKVSVPKQQDLAKELKAKNIPDYQKEAELVISAIKRHNAMVDFIAAQGKIESIDFGGDTSTPEGRTIVLNNMQQMINTRLTALLYKYNGAKKFTPQQKVVMDKIAALKAPNQSNRGEVEQYTKQLDDIATSMVNTPDFRVGVPDMQEIFDFMNKLGHGYAGFMPAASNWKVTDIVTYKPTPSFLIKAGQRPSAEIAKNLQAFKSDVLIEGGLSVKFEKGGASAGMDKVAMTTYKHQGGGFDTKKEIIKMFATYEWSFTPGSKDKRVKSAAEVNNKQRELNDVVKRAVANGVIDKNTAKEAMAEGERQAGMMAKKIESKVPFKKYAKCFGKNSVEQKKNYETYKQQCGMWCKMGAIAEAINNADIDYQLFGNLRTKYTKKGIQHETIDGVNTVSGMGWSYDPGIAATGKECKYLALNNANSSHIEPIKK